MHGARQSNVSRLHNIHAKSAINKDRYATKITILDGTYSGYISLMSIGKWLLHFTDIRLQ